MEQTMRLAMHADQLPDPAGPVFSLNFPGYRMARGGGTLPFSIGDAVRAEISHDDLLESWQEARGLTPSEAEKMTAAAAAQLTRILESGLESADITEAVTDAAVVLLLALRRQGISNPKRIPPCTVIWHGQDNREHVLLGA
jgi:hypothetical protein